MGVNERGGRYLNPSPINDGDCQNINKKENKIYSNIIEDPNESDVSMKAPLASG